MWFFIINILSLYIEAPLIDLIISASNSLSYYINDDYIEVDLYIELETYLYYEDIDIFNETKKELAIEVQLPIPEDFNVNEVASVTSYVQFGNFDMIISPDTTTINYQLNVDFQLMGRNDNVITYDNRSINGYIFKEVSIEYPYYVNFEDYYMSYNIKHDIRGFTADEIYQEGYNDGYNDGEQEGYYNGYFDGYNDGEYNGSMTQPIFKLFNAVFRVIDNVLSVEILPGIKIWYILGVPFVFLIIQFFINLWR